MADYTSTNRRDFDAWAAVQARLRLIAEVYAGDDPDKIALDHFQRDIVGLLAALEKVRDA